MLEISYFTGDYFPVNGMPLFRKESFISYLYSKGLVKKLCDLDERDIKNRLEVIDRKFNWLKQELKDNDNSQ